MDLDSLAEKVHIYSTWKGIRFDYTNRKIRDYTIVDWPKKRPAVLYEACWVEAFPDGSMTFDPEAFFSLFDWDGQLGIEVCKLALARVVVEWNGKTLACFPESRYGRPQVGFFTQVGI